jgi:hypothetical protein
MPWPQMIFARLVAPHESVHNPPLTVCEVPINAAARVIADVRRSDLRADRQTHLTSLPFLSLATPHCEFGVCTVEATSGLPFGHLHHG